MDVQEDRTVSLSLELSAEEYELLADVAKRVMKDTDSFDTTNSYTFAEEAKPLNPVPNLKPYTMFAIRRNEPNGSGSGDGPDGNGNGITTPTPPRPVIETAITVEQEDVIDNSSPQRMFTKASFWLTGPLAGRLKAKTRTWTGIDLHGFGGGVRIALLNANGDLVATTNLHTFGVDGDSWLLPGGPSDRTDTWEEQFDPNVVAMTTQLLIEHNHSGKNRLLPILQEAAKYGEIILGVIV
jgi:hypothetical protein